MTVSPQYLAEHYDDVASAVNGGEVVEVSLPEKPALRLVPALQQAAKRTAPRVLGAGKALLRVPTEAEWAEMDRELERDMNGPLFPSHSEPVAEA